MKLNIAWINILPRFIKIMITSYRSSLPASGQKLSIKILMKILMK